jgi:VIT1/CCC1 family predicted Fe2+/Mn2+ transporter
MRSISFASYLRNFVFGTEDSLVSTVGLLSGITIAGMASKEIIVTGAVLIFVEAFSMAVGSFLSEYSAEEYLHQAGASSRRSVVDGVIMFFSYLIAGAVPLFPYIFWEPSVAFSISIFASLAALFVLGAVSARVAEVSIAKRGLRMLVVGGIAIAVGVLVGQITSQY